MIMYVLPIDAMRTEAKTQVVNWLGLTVPVVSPSSHWAINS
jgi:hypothetical protein